MQNGECSVQLLSGTYFWMCLCYYMIYIIPSVNWVLKKHRQPYQRAQLILTEFPSECLCILKVPSLYLYFPSFLLSCVPAALLTVNVFTFTMRMLGFVGFDSVDLIGLLGLALLRSVRVTSGSWAKCCLPNLRDRKQQ